MQVGFTQEPVGKKPADGSRSWLPLAPCSVLGAIEAIFFGLPAPACLCPDVPHRMACATLVVRVVESKATKAAWSLGLHSRLRCGLHCMLCCGQRFGVCCGHHCRHGRNHGCQGSHGWHCGPWVRVGIGHCCRNGRNHGCQGSHKWHCGHGRGCDKGCCGGCFFALVFAHGWHTLSVTPAPSNTFAPCLATSCAVVHTTAATLLIC